MSQFPTPEMQEIGKHPGPWPPYLTKVWINNHYWYIYTRRKYGLATMRLGRNYLGVVSYKRA